MSISTICVAGAESTGKSWLAAKLAAHFGLVAVKEYARDYCQKHGNNLTFEQLLHIAEVQDTNLRYTTRRSFDAGRGLVIADTDGLVTAVWGEFLLGRKAADFPYNFVCADLYLVTENDLPWQDDGVRCQTQQAQRDKFRKLLVKELDRRKLHWAPVAGTGEQRFATALGQLAAHVRGISV